jgi:hypothetical protein
VREHDSARQQYANSHRSFDLRGADRKQNAGHRRRPAACGSTTNRPTDDHRSKRLELAKQLVSLCPSCEARRPLVDGSAVRYCEGVLLVILKCDLLCQHNVGDGEVPLGAEAPRGRACAAFVELVNIHLAGTADAITFAAMAASYFEMPIIFVLSELRWG